MIKQNKNRCWEHIIYDGKEYLCRMLRGRCDGTVVIGSYAFEEVLRPFQYTEDELDFADDEAEELYFSITGFVDNDVLASYDNKALVRRLIEDNLHHLEDFVTGTFDIRIYFDKEYPIRLFTDSEDTVLAVGTMDLLRKVEADPDEGMTVDDQIFYYVDNEKIAWEDKDLIKYIFDNCGIQLKPIINETA